MESFMGDLSACETMIMKVIWDAKEDIALQDLIRELADRYKKNYARTTVVTFVHKIVDKGFATTYRKGKAAYIHPKKVWQPIGMSCYNSSWSFGLTENHPHFCLPGVKKINCPARKQTGSEK